MARRIAMWIAVFALAALGAVSAASAVIFFLRAGNTGWTFYTPYSVSSLPSPLAEVSGLCALAQRILLPVAAASSAVYLYLAERAFQHLQVTRGFEIQIGGHSGGI